MDNPVRSIIKAKEIAPRWVAMLLEGKHVIVSSYPDGSTFIEFKDDYTDNNGMMPEADDEEHALLDLVYALDQFNGLTQSKHSTEYKSIYWLDPIGRRLLLSDIDHLARQYDAIYAPYRLLQRQASEAHKEAQVSMDKLMKAFAEGLL